MAISKRNRNALLTLVIVLLLAATLAAQGNTPKTPWGDPDLQGVWSIATITPFERPAALKDKAQLTPEEAAAAEETFRKTQNQDRRDGAGTDADVALAYNDFWWDRGSKVVSTRQTSLVVDPPDGRVPAYTAEGKARASARAARGYDSWEDRSLWERALPAGCDDPWPTTTTINFHTRPRRDPQNFHDAPSSTGRPHVGQNILQCSALRSADGKHTLVVDPTNSPTMRPKGTLTAAFRALHSRQRRHVNTNSPRRSDPFTKKWTFAIPIAIRRSDSISTVSRGNTAVESAECARVQETTPVK